MKMRITFFFISMLLFATTSAWAAYSTAFSKATFYYSGGSESYTTASGSYNCGSKCKRYNVNGSHCSATTKVYGRVWKNGTAGTSSYHSWAWSAYWDNNLPYAWSLGSYGHGGNYVSGSGRNYYQYADWEDCTVHSDCNDEPMDIDDEDKYMKIGYRYYSSGDSFKREFRCY